jgi:hypothetical protein
MRRVQRSPARDREEDAPALAVEDVPAGAEVARGQAHRSSAQIHEPVVPVVSAGMVPAVG